MTLCIHIRPRHITADGLDRLRSVLAEHPGGDRVEIQTYSERFRLPVTVDAAARGLTRAVHFALGGASTALVIGLEEPW